MAFPIDYDGWVALLKDFLDVDDFNDDKLGTFLSLAQTRLNRELNSQYMEGYANPIISGGSGIIDLFTAVPDFNRVRLVTTVSTAKPLDVLAINEYYDYVNKGYTSGDPRWYTIEALSLNTLPYAADGEMLELYYYVKVPEISESNPDNIFTTYHPDALLYASCLEGSRFIVEDERVPMWNDAYNQALDNANLVAKQSKLGSTPLKRQISLYSQNVRMH
jgi:hypothetical protein